MPFFCVKKQNFIYGGKKGDLKSVGPVIQLEVESLTKGPFIGSKQEKSYEHKTIIQPSTLIQLK